jgi:hypothetical protein
MYKNLHKSKTEIARRIEEAMTGRVGGDTRSCGSQINPQNIAEWKGTESRDIAAKAIGWNRATMQTLFYRLQKSY